MHICPEVLKHLRRAHRRYVTGFLCWPVVSSPCEAATSSVLSRLSHSFTFSFPPEPVRTSRLVWDHDKMILINVSVIIKQLILTCRLSSKMLLQVLRTILSWREDFLSPAWKTESGKSGNKSFCTQLLFCPKKKSRICLLIIFFFRLTGGPVGGSIESGYKWDGNTYFCSRLYIMGLWRWPQCSSQFSLFSSKREFTSPLRNGRLHCLWQAGTLDGQTSSRFGASSSHQHSQLWSLSQTRSTRDGWRVAFRCSFRV